VQDPKVAEKRRMEEGRRMFHIFAARMFEQRVLAAYREKVARERQQKLLEEIEEEDRKAEEKTSKKAKEKERKKERQRALKQQKEEERLKKEAEKAAEEVAKRLEEEKKAEEARKKKEDARLKREAERKQAEMERIRKEEERRKRQAEERERQAELERKRREKEEAAKKRREENLRKEKEAKDAKEREAKERREREERERREKMVTAASVPPATPKPASAALPKRQTTPVSPLRPPTQVVIPKGPTPNRPNIPLTTTPPHQLVNDSTSTTPGTAHTPSPCSSASLQPHLAPAHFHGPVAPPPGTGFPSPSLRNQFPAILENPQANVPPHMMGSNSMPQGRQGLPPLVNGMPLGIYAPLPIGSPGQFGRFGPVPGQPGGFPLPNPLPHSLGRGFVDPAPPTPSYPPPIGSMPSMGSPILPPPSKAVESGMSSPSLSHSRKASSDPLGELPGTIGSRPPGLNGAGGPPPGLSRTIQRPAPIQRPQSTASQGRGNGFPQDEEMGVGSRALMDERVEDLLGEDEIIEPSSVGAPGLFSQSSSRRPNTFPSIGDKLWAAPSSTSASADTMWGQPDTSSFLWGPSTASSPMPEDIHSFQNWDAPRPFPTSTTSTLTPLQERVKEVLNRSDPQNYQPVDQIVAQLQRSYPTDRVGVEDVVAAAQASPTAFLVTHKKGKWVIRGVNPSDTRSVMGARMMAALGPKPGTPPTDVGRNMLGSLAEVVRGFE